MRRLLCSRFGIELDGGDLLGRGNVVAGLEVGGIDQAERFDDGFGRSSEGEAATHVLFLAVRLCRYLILRHFLPQNCECRTLRRAFSAIAKSPSISRLRLISCNSSYN